MRFRSFMPRRRTPWRAPLLGAACATLLATGTARADHPKTPPKAQATSKAPQPMAKPSRVADAATRRLIAGGPTVDDVRLGVESPELVALRDAERELFPPAAPPPGQPWPTDLPSPLATAPDRPIVHASGLPPAPPARHPFDGEAAPPPAWLSQLQLPDIPVRWDPRVVRYLEFFKDDPRGRATFTTFFRRSGKYRDLIRRTLRRKSLPEDLAWVAMVESGFDAVARSPAGAAGLWQFMPDTGKLYGLSQDRWLDQRLAVQPATEAAADFLSDLHRRFGSWELSLAAYNMGYGGLSSVVRRFNTNDFWALSQMEGSLPWETTLYVPKILAVAVVAHNLAAFGYADLAPDPALDVDEVRAPPGTALATVAQAAGCPSRDLETLNPELRASRTPPADDAAPGGYPVKVPHGKGAQAAEALARLRRDAPALERYVVRFGESLEQIALERKIALSRLVELNGIAPGEVVRGGVVLLVPKLEAQASATPAPPAKQSVVVPADIFIYPGKKRVFYKVAAGDNLKEIATSFHADLDDLRRWNGLDASARLLEGMTLQVYVPEAQDLSGVVVTNEGDVQVLPVGSEEFYAHLEAEKGLKRVTVTARAGDSLESIGKRFKVPARTMERVNRRGRSEPLREGEPVVVYLPGAPGGATGPTAQASADAPAPNGPLPAAPIPDLLP
jgi:peptidoglycan lytic transglycosylase D